MPYTQVDHDAIKRAMAAAPVLCLPPQQVIGGLTMLWAWCWSEKRDHVTPIQLEGFIGTPSPRLAEVLIAFEFLAVDGGGLRVRGADKYLRLTEARKRGAEITNQRRLSDARAPLERRLTDGGATQNDALTPYTNHHTPDTSHQEHMAAAPLALVPEPGILEVFSHYRERMGGNGPMRPGKGQAAHIRARLRDGWKVEELKAVVDGALADIRQWPERVKHLGIGVLFRDDDHVRKFLITAEASGAR